MNTLSHLNKGLTKEAKPKTDESTNTKNKAHPS